MATYYLIRRNLETFLGPMRLHDLKKAHRSMAFGLQDEVSGHCGPWVKFENVDSIKRHYPEVARIVHQELMNGWGISDHSARKLVKGREEVTMKLEKKRSVGVAIAFLMLALGAAVAAYFLARNVKMSGKQLMSDGIKPQIEQVSDLIQGQDTQPFLNYMEQAMPNLAQGIKSDKDLFVTWAPYIRAYAFMKDGTALGVHPKLLRGAGTIAAPMDCSLKAWKRRWKGSVKSWGPFLSGKRLVKAHWARILSWDPWWIARRPMKGWIVPASYYDGCTTMASRALDEVSGEILESSQGMDPNFMTKSLQSIQSRLRWILDTSTHGDPGRVISPDNVDDSLSLLSCIEGASSQEEINLCRQKLNLGEEWLPYVESRYTSNLLRLIINNPGSVVDTKSFGDWNSAIDDLAKGDFFTRFEYKMEVKFWRNLTRLNGDIEKSIDATEREFTPFKLR